MDAQGAALGEGVRETRAALGAWRADSWRILDRWVGWSLAFAVGLLLAVLIVAELTASGSAPFSSTTLAGGGDLGDVTTIISSNLLVLALHALACVAGFIAGSALPRQARLYTGARYRLHALASPFAIAFVAAATAFSLSTQAWVLGGAAATLAAEAGVAPVVLMVSILPHALPELIVLFLPLAAWVVASRRGEWHTLLAATAVTVAIAVPVLVLTAALETFVTPRLLGALAG